MPMHLEQWTELLLYFQAFLLSLDLLLLLRLYLPLVRCAARPIYLDSASQPFISVILRAHGEPQRLQRALDALLSQDYRHYEVIVVNDSTDEESAYLLERLRRQHQHLKVTLVATDHKFVTAQNLAFTVGAKAASGEWLLFTHSGAQPAAQGWLGAMATRMDQSTDVVIGYGAYASGGSRMAATILRWQRLVRLGYAQWKCFYLADTCNLAIRRHRFLEDHKQLGIAQLRNAAPLHLATQWAKQCGTRLCIPPMAHVLEDPPPTWTNFLYWRSARRAAQLPYSFCMRAALAAEPTLRVSLWALAAALLISQGISAWYPLGALALRYATLLVLALSLRFKLHDAPWGLGALLADLFMPFFALYPTPRRRSGKMIARWR